MCSSIVVPLICLQFLLLLFGSREWEKMARNAYNNPKDGGTSNIQIARPKMNNHVKLHRKEYSRKRERESRHRPMQHAQQIFLLIFLQMAQFRSFAAAKRIDNRFFQYKSLLQVLFLLSIPIHSQLHSHVLSTDQIRRENKRCNRIRRK